MVLLMLIIVILMLIVVLLILINDWIAQIVPRLIIVSGWCTIQILDTNLHIFSPQNNSPPPKQVCWNRQSKNIPCRVHPRSSCSISFGPIQLYWIMGWIPLFYGKKPPMSLDIGSADRHCPLRWNQVGQIVQATDTWMTADVGLSWRIEPTAAWWKIRGQGQLLFFLEIHKNTKCWIWSDFWEPYFWFLIYN